MALPIEGSHEIQYGEELITIRSNHVMSEERLLYGYCY